ncbi:MAG: ferredoxin--NADP reductase [Planctomycetes bacterium]|nr:ferredoxin--NADP reductase [Planctomycetota bacterium]
MLPEQIAEARKKRYNGTVISVQKSHSDLMIIRVKSDFPRPEHLPGQYGTLGLGNWEPRMPGCQDDNLKPEDEAKLVRRAYSISCSILDDKRELLDISKTDYLEFYIVLVRENLDGRPPALTPRLFMLNPGDRLSIGEKLTGHYTLETVKDGDNVIFLGTGTGEAPHNYMLWELLRRGHKGQILSASCVRFKRDLGYLATHFELSKRYPNYKYLPLTTREAATVHHKVYIQDLITSGQLQEQLGATLDPARTHVFLCGNPKMIGVPVKDPTTGERKYPETVGVIQLLEERGFQADYAPQKIKGNIHFEEYW